MATPIDRQRGLTRPVDSKHIWITARLKQEGESELKTPERLDRHDRQIMAIRARVQEGMRLGVEARRDIRALATAQRRTEENLQTLINTLGRGVRRGMAHSYKCRKLRR